jgi:hypothetical protein
MTTVEERARQAAERHAEVRFGEHTEHENVCRFESYRDGYIQGATEDRAALERANRALDNHLCEYDKADWLACSGHPGEQRCDVCDESDKGLHRHALLERLARAEDALRYIANLCLERYGQQPHHVALHRLEVDIPDAVEKALTAKEPTP